MGVPIIIIRTVYVEIAQLRLSSDLNLLSCIVTYSYTSTST